MTIMIRLLLWLTILLSFLNASALNAELLLRAGGKLIYDTDQNLTWFADANYAQTTGFNPDLFVAGFMFRHSATQWVNSFTYAGLSDWRLPTTTQPDPSCSVQTPDGKSTTFNCIGSELGYMFYIHLGGIAITPISTQHNNNYYLFKNINDQYGYYWADPLPADSLRSWAFRFDLGYQNTELRTTYSSVWPVRDGDIALIHPPDGDINTDGQVNIKDVRLAFEFITNQKQASALEYLHGDIAPLQNGISQPDGNITTGDLLLIALKVMGKPAF